MEPGFTAVKVASIRAESPSLSLLELDVVGSSVEGQFTTPGQYLRMVLGDQITYFAMCSAPEERSRLQFLIRMDGRVGERVRDLRPGDEVEISGVEGMGFPLEGILGRELVLMATGTGLAPLRSLIQSPLSAQFPRIHLYFGTTTLAEVPFLDEMETWRGRGLHIRLALSRGDEPRYVQDLLHTHPGVLGESAALVCGNPVMMDAVSLALQEAGMPTPYIRRNF